MPAREIVEEPGFREDCDALGDVEQMDAALTYITHVLALDPAVGVPIGDSGIWAMPSRILRKPSPVLYYRFTEDKVFLIALKALGSK